MKTESTSLKRMETMLRIWEQILFVANAELRVVSPDEVTGAVKNWRKFRETVLDLSRPFPLVDFQMSTKRFLDYFLTFIGFEALPKLVAGWSRSSRRVYSLTPDMQAMLELTAIGRVTWEDVNPPFPYFVVSLPLPLKNPWSKLSVPNLIDTLLVALDKERGTIEIIPMGNELESFRFLTPELRRRAGALVKGGNLRKIHEFFSYLRRENYCFIPPNTYLHHACGPHARIFPDILDDEHIAVESWDEKGREIKLDEDQIEWWRPIFRIVLGLCLHLDLGRESERTKSAVSLSREHFTLDEKSVSDGAELCTVQFEHELTSDERRIHEIFREKGVLRAMKELGSHFRGGYWRRPPGQGSDPLARKSVKVRWAIVNQRRLPEGALPQGANVLVGNATST